MFACLRTLRVYACAGVCLCDHLQKEARETMELLKALPASRVRRLLCSIGLGALTTSERERKRLGEGRKPNLVSSRAQT